MKKTLITLILLFLAAFTLTAQERPGYAFVRTQSDLMLQTTATGKGTDIRPAATALNVAAGIGYRFTPYVSVAVGFGGYRGLYEQFPNKSWKENQISGGQFFTSVRINTVQAWKIMPVVDLEAGWNFMGGTPDAKQLNDNKYKDYISASDHNVVCAYNGAYLRLGVGWKFPILTKEAIIKFYAAVYDTFIGGQSGRPTKDYRTPQAGGLIYVPDKLPFKERLQPAVGLSLEFNL